MTDDLEARIRRLEDRAEISLLVAEYGVAVDDRDMATLGDLFTDDAVFRHADGFAEMRGRDTVIDFYQNRFRLFGPSFHYPHSHAIWFPETTGAGDATTATGRVTAHAELGTEGKTVMVALRYHDRYVCQGRWRFAERVLSFLYFMDLAELAAGGLTAPMRKIWPGPTMATDLPETLPTWRSYYGLA